MTEPTFGPVDLTELQDAGVLAMANQRFFWPLGLALTWDYDKATGTASGLHVREWRYPDGHVEAIGEDPADAIMEVRRQRFAEWANARLLRMPIREELIDASELVSGLLGELWTETLNR